MSAKSYVAPTLYHKGKTGKVVAWNVWTEGAQVHVEWGQVDGAKQTTSTTATAKNIGKKNELKAEAQAIIEAKAMWQHRIDRKYSETIEESQETVFLPMLAHSFEKCKDSKKFPIVYPVDVQPKLDGLRALAFWKQDSVVLISRQGIPWDLPHITNEIAKFLPKDLVLDGEIYKHGVMLQDINHLTKGNEPGPDGTESLKFYAFDLFDPVDDIPWTLRYADLCELLSTENPVITLVVSISCNSEQEIYDLCQIYTEQGYEGGIVRLAHGEYELGYRSRSLLKVKFFLDDEFEVIGHYKGEGLHTGCVGFICKTKPGSIAPDFRVYPKGSMDQRRAYGKDPESYYGKKLTVRYQFLTNEGKPFLPIGIAFRDAKDLPSG